MNTEQKQILLRKKGKKASSGLADSSDSLLDLLCNVVGVLVLVSSLAGVFAATSAVNIQAPMKKETKKQTNKPKQREWVGDYFLQMAAYGMAHDVIHGTEIEQGVIMMCSKDGYYQQFVIEGEEFRQAKHEFLGRVNEFYDSMGDNSNAVVSGSG